jgi:hypothetical protein
VLAGRITCTPRDHPGEGPAFVLMHTFLDNSHLFREQRRAMLRRPETECS